MHSSILKSSCSSGPAALPARGDDNINQEQHQPRSPSQTNKTPSTSSEDGGPKRPRGQSRRNVIHSPPDDNQDRSLSAISSSRHAGLTADMERHQSELSQGKVHPMEQAATFKCEDISDDMMFDLMMSIASTSRYPTQEGPLYSTWDKAINILSRIFTGPNRHYRTELHHQLSSEPDFVGLRDPKIVEKEQGLTRSEAYPQDTSDVAFARALIEKASKRIPDLTQMLHLVCPIPPPVPGEQTVNFAVLKSRKILIAEIKPRRRGRKGPTTGWELSETLPQLYSQAQHLFDEIKDENFKYLGGIVTYGTDWSYIGLKRHEIRPLGWTWPAKPLDVAKDNEPLATSTPESSPDTSLISPERPDRLDPGESPTYDAAPYEPSPEKPTLRQGSSVGLTRRQKRSTKTRPRIDVMPMDAILVLPDDCVKPVFGTDYFLSLRDPKKRWLDAFKLIAEEIKKNNRDMCDDGEELIRELAATISDLHSSDTDEDESEGRDVARNLFRQARPSEDVSDKSASSNNSTDDPFLLTHGLTGRDSAVPATQSTSSSSPVTYGRSGQAGGTSMQIDEFSDDEIDFFNQRPLSQSSPKRRVGSGQGGEQGSSSQSMDWEST